MKLMFYKYFLYLAAALSGGVIDVIAYVYGSPLVEQKQDLCTVLPKVGLKCPIKKGRMYILFKP